MWFRELELVGAYASRDGTDDFADATGARRDARRSDGFVDAVYPLSRWREAIGHALPPAGWARVKVAFDSGGAAERRTDEGA